MGVLPPGSGHKTHFSETEREREREGERERDRERERERDSCVKKDYFPQDFSWH